MDFKMSNKDKAPPSLVKNTDPATAPTIRSSKIDLILIELCVVVNVLDSDLRYLLDTLEKDCNQEVDLTTVGKKWPENIPNKDKLSYILEKLDDIRKTLIVNSKKINDSL
jgi:hypothetical protein